MALGKIKNGAYGKYYEYYIDGEKHILGLEDKKPSDASFKGATPETPEQIDELLEKSKVDFIFNGENVHAELVPYVNRKGETVSIVKYSKAEIVTETTNADLSIIESNKDKIINIFSDNSDKGDNFYARLKTDELLKSIGLSKYHCGVERTELSSVVRVIIYKGIKADMRNEANRLYIMLLKSGVRSSAYKVARTEISASEYLNELNNYNENLRLAKEKEDALQKVINETRAEAKEWLNNLHKQIFGGNTSLTPRQVIDALEPVVSSIPKEESSVLVAPRSKLYEIIDVSRANYIGSYGRRDKCKEDFEEMKTNVLKNLRHMYDYRVLAYVRDSIYNDVKENGLKSVVDGMSTEEALNYVGIMEFRKFKHTLVKSSYPINTICYNVYKNIIDPDELYTGILNLLKVYYDFTDFPTKDIKAIAKFVAVHKLDEYYDILAKCEDAIDIIIKDGSSDFRKKALLEVAGSGKVGKSFNIDELKASNHYFEKTAKLRTDDRVNAVDILNDLRALIGEFNVSSDVAILMNIELDADESFVYQFCTFTDDETGANLDGRRVQYMTKLYNRGRPDNKKIHFTFEF